MMEYWNIVLGIAEGVMVVLWRKVDCTHPSSEAESRDIHPLLHYYNIRKLHHRKSVNGYEITYYKIIDQLRCDATCGFKGCVTLCLKL